MRRDHRKKVKYNTSVCSLGSGIQQRFTTLDISTGGILLARKDSWGRHGLTESSIVECNLYTDYGTINFLAKPVRFIGEKELALKIVQIDDREKNNLGKVSEQPNTI